MGGEWLKEKGFKQQSNPNHYRYKVPGFGGQISVFLAGDNQAYVIYTINNIYSDIIHGELKETINKAHSCITGTALP